jgi:hypothetical protein
MVGHLADGRPDVRTVFAATEKACLAKLDETICKAKPGTLADAAKERDTVATYLERWAVTRKRSVLPQTHRR